MYFADELRNYNPQEEQNRIISAMLDRDASLFEGLLRQACLEANTRNRRNVSIYCTSRQDDGYKHHEFIEQLPTVQQKMEESKRFNKEGHLNTGINSVGTGKSEIRLYSNLISYNTQNLKYAQALQKRLNNEISKMGFINYKVSLIELDDIFIIYNRKAGYFSGKVTEELSTRKAGKIYILNLQATW